MDKLLEFLLNNSIWLMGIVLLLIFVIDFYETHVKVNEDTHNVDLMNRYLWLQLHRRYRRGKEI